MGQAASKTVAKAAPAAVTQTTKRATAPVVASSEDMPDDLLKFLHDAGPLKPTTKQQQQQQPRPQRQWQVQSMRLAENVPGHDTKRTTSFSYRSDADETFRLDVVAFYPLLAQTTSVEHLYQQRSSETSKASESDMEKLHDTIRYLQLPLIMKDVEDNSYIGVRAEQIPFGLEQTNAEQVKLVIQDLWEMEQQGNS
ncbi:hypothetical protein FisN_8Hh206 [Fistulifera solaris]|jgi:hypothetical protein|uniref:Uncharacterized protein n=1 Tax=Fistulifera solaris TaxID=1519565 RepID=A0A1Z5JY68_FISSO|nr:hypothetical protein FisN_8Hh206 [Fistulifera solaris]|eukprot:GAX18985.1 hypothetical protein FisN_8Hh206 [Fistulifera solaris]